MIRQIRNLAAVFVFSALSLAATTGAQATVVVNNSPDAIGGLAPGLTALNQAAAQNFLVQFTLAAGETLNGADIYSDFIPEVPFLGTAVTIKFRADVAGSPGPANLFTIASVISAVDSIGSSAVPAIQRLHADFADIFFGPGTYWFGMSGTTSEIGWNFEFNRPGSNPLWVLNGDTLVFTPPNTAAGFRLEANRPIRVPEPSTIALLAIALFLLLGLGQLRNRSAT